jgi:hypothetical protein
MKVENPHHGGWQKFEQQKFWTIRLLISPPLCKLFFQFQADASATDEATYSNIIYCIGQQ